MFIHLNNDLRLHHGVTGTLNFPQNFFALGIPDIAFGILIAVSQIGKNSICQFFN